MGLHPLNLVAQAREKKIGLAFVTPCGADQIDVVLNERYICFYTKSDKEECFIQLDWKSCFKNDEEPTYTDFQTYLKKAKVKFLAGIFQFNLHAVS